MPGPANRRPSGVLNTGNSFAGTVARLPGELRAETPAASLSSRLSWSERSSKAVSPAGARCRSLSNGRGPTVGHTTATSGKRSYGKMFTGFLTTNQKKWSGALRKQRSYVQPSFESRAPSHQAYCV
jgi:hypothetical protein